jgi:Protein of unknown function (DUF1553)/Protein of unknown function (DUF1549)/Concanavalin A-like lectin/glucanases superfamily/Planctomycete cytochrome C
VNFTFSSLHTAVSSIAVLVISAVSPATAVAQSDSSIEFDKHVVPILVSRCLECHNATERKGEFDFTTSASAKKKPGILGGGDVVTSKLWQLVEQDEMPPTKPLPENEKAVLKKWLERGAAWGSIDPIDPLAITTASRAGSDWWSLRPIQRPSLPEVKSKDRIRTPVDAFVVQKLESQSLSLSPPTDKATLLRRVYLDLIGLPPTPEELESFLRDRDERAFEKLVDRLLDSPHYGQRWARHWLDVARYTESQGFEYDRFRPNAWHYRDYVIQSFNADKPYDQFIREQIAGDVDGFAGPNSKPNSESIIATSLLVCGPWDQAGNGQANVTQRMATREEEMEDLVSVIGQSFLGITINCARCHDHKFDPISQEDYFRFKACFDGVKHGERSVETEENVRTRQEQLAGLQSKQSQLQNTIAQIEKEARERVLASQSFKEAVAGPAPFARWDFEISLNDTVGEMHAELVGGAKINNGRLILQGNQQYAKTQPLKETIREKTLEAWVAIAEREQGGGGVVSLETKNGGTFDAIVYGERQSRKWISGSNGFVRTRDLEAAPEDSPADSLIHMAIVYRNDGMIEAYRNGQRYAEGYNPGPIAEYAANESHLLFGLRHTGAGNGFLKAEIEAASMYNRALTSDEVLRIFQAGPEGGPVVTAQELQQAMSPQHRQVVEGSREQLKALKAQLEKLAKPLVSYVGLRQQPPPTHRLLRGDVSKPGEVVSPAPPSRLASPNNPAFQLDPDSPESLRRLRIAQWLSDPQHPLTPRVMVNRIWHYHFGRGIVETPNDFGFNGSSPSHPELLDWLSDEFVRGPRPWSIKHIHRLIVNSSVYQQSSKLNPAAFAVDADNAWLWRYSPRRLEGEVVRDLMLAVSGELNTELGGPSFKPFKVTSFNSDFYQPTDPIGVEFNRRTIYRANINSGKSAMMDALDCPDPSIKTPARRVTTTPIAALALMNNSFVLRQAKQLANRLSSQESISQQIAVAYRICLSRDPSKLETEQSIELATQHGLDSFCWVLLNSSEFLYVD